MKIKRLLLDLLQLGWAGAFLALAGFILLEFLINLIEMWRATP